MGMQGSVYDSLYLSVPTIFFFDVLLNVFIAFLLGLMISSIYRLTFKGYSYSASFVNTLIIITMVTSIVMMVIGNNLARAFGLVGAMSIIRFRAAVKDTRDIVFVFFSLAAGMAAGAGNHMIGVVGCVFVSVIIVMLFATQYGSIYRDELLLRFWIVPESGEADPAYLSVFKKYLSDHKLLNVRSTRMGQFVELAFTVRFKKAGSYHHFINELNSIEGLERVNMLLGEENHDI
jgi:hypothetical protein